MVGREPSEGWPDVDVGGDFKPYVDHVVGEEERLAGPKEVLAYGTVNSIPWSLVAFTTIPVGNWWDAPRAVGPMTEFFLGGNGWFGGGSSHAVVPEGTHLRMSGRLFGGFPDFGAWVAYVSDVTAEIEVERAAGDVRRFVPVAGPPGFPRYALLFLPRHPALAVRALDAAGGVLQEEVLPERVLRPDEDSSMHVGPGLSWREGEPPPGWPPETRTFATGEGPRWREDFYLHVARFPVYVLPPDAWSGVAGLGGAVEGGSGIVSRIGFIYLDTAGTPERGILVLSSAPAAVEQQLAHQRPFPGREGVWWLTQAPAGSDVVNFVHRFRRSEDSERPPHEWLVMALAPVHIEVSGTPVAVECWAFRDHPELVVLRIALPEVVLVVQGWNVSWDDLLRFARRLEAMTLHSGLCRRMKESQAAWDAAWDAVSKGRCCDVNPEGRPGS